MSAEAREAVLGRIRRALADVPAPEGPRDVEVPRDYRHTDDRDRDALLELFADRVRDYNAEVVRVGPQDIGGAVSEACREASVGTVVIPPALPPAWRPEDVEIIEDDGRPGRELDGIDGTVTGCAVAIAETGTIVLDAGVRQGRRAISLVPDHHVCVVEAEQVVGIVPEALGRLAEAGSRGRPITFISGPSASSDIELTRVEGVHGPRHLLVILVG